MRVDNYTPYELVLIAKQRKEAQTREFENSIALAWHIEAFARQKKLPQLDKVLRNIRKKSKKTNSVSDRILRAMAAEKGVIIP